MKYSNLKSHKLLPDYQRLPLSGERPKQLVLLLHGVGSNGVDLFSLADSWAPLLPEAEFISPNAPFAFDGGPYDDHHYPHSYQWFSIKNISPESREKRLRETVPILNAFIDELLVERDLPESALALVGFSQGAIMSLFTGLRRENTVGAILAYAGRLTSEEGVRRELRSRPRTMLVHGTADEIIPIQEFHESTRILSDLQVPLLSIPIPGLGHGFSPSSEQLGGSFLQRCLPNPEWQINSLAPLSTEV